MLTIMVCVSAAQQIPSGPWRAVLIIPGGELPFTFIVREEGGKILADILNAEEKLTADHIRRDGDSVFMRMPFFDSEIRAKISGKTMEGNWFNYVRTQKNIIPFKAEHGVVQRFTGSEKPSTDFSGRWEVDFSPGSPDSSKAVGVFMQKEGRVTGTFLTTTGDYRYLEGIAEGNKMRLSCFDGSHAFLFSATLQPDGTLKGDFWSGLHWHESWQGKRNEKFELPDPDKLTWLKEGFNSVSFSFPDTDSNMVSLSDEHFRNKVTVVQIMGSWCPNCMDETAFLSDFYKRYKARGFEVVGLSYERTPDFQRAASNINRLKQRLGVEYKVLVAGKSSDTKLVAQSLPMLNHVMSFPTTIIIDKKGVVRKIHTGFNGPATGKYYEKFKDDFENFINRLLEE